MAVRFKFVSSLSWTPQKSSESFSWPALKGSANFSALFFKWLKQIGQDASKGVHAWWKQWKQASEKWQGLATVLVRHHSRWGEAFIGNCASKVGRYYFGFFSEKSTCWSQEQSKYALILKVVHSEIFLCVKWGTVWGETGLFDKVSPQAPFIHVGSSRIWLQSRFIQGH